MTNQYWSRKALKIIQDAHPGLKLDGIQNGAGYFIALADGRSVRLMPNDDYLSVFNEVVPV